MVGLRRVSRIVAVALWITAFASLLATFKLLPLPQSGLVPPAAAVPGFATVGMLLIRHRPLNVVGWLMLGMGALPAVATFAGVTEPALLIGMVLVCLVLVLVVFPDGRLPSVLWLTPIGLLAVGWTMALAFPGLIWTQTPGFEVPVGVAVGMAGVVWCAAAPFARYRRAEGIERLQLRWLGATAGFTALAGSVALLSLVLQAATVVGEFAALVGMVGVTLGIPASIFIAVTRYRLYGIDRIVSRTISYTVVVVLLALVFSVGAIWAPTWLIGEGHPLFVAGSTLAVAALFNPLRRRVQRAVDRRFNRSAYRAEVVAAEFAAELHRSLSIEELTRLLDRTVSDHLLPATSVVWVGTPVVPARQRG